MSSAPRRMALNVFLAAGGYHAGSWRRDGSRSDELCSLDLMRDLARTAESAKLDAVFVSDAMGLEDHRRTSPRLIELEPITLISALAGVTDRIGLIATVSTSFTAPFNLARYLTSLDHLSGGRVGWNIVTSTGGNANFGVELPPHDERYAVADEYIDVVTALWDSWEDDAVIDDHASGLWADADRIHEINHAGKYFSVRGPSHLPRSPQGWPLLVQAGSSATGTAFAAKRADVIFTAQPDLGHAQTFYAAAKSQAAAHGRNPDDLKVLPGLMPIIADTEKAAYQLADELSDLVTLDVGLRLLGPDLAAVDLSDVGLDDPIPVERFPDPSTVMGTRSRYELYYELGVVQRKSLRELVRIAARSMGHSTAIGTPEQVADQMEKWFAEGGCDGFNLQMAYSPGSLDDIATQLVPELVSRGLFREEYEEPTLRGHLGLARR